MKHLVFYDGSCGLCDHMVQFLLKKDKYILFAFAPLKGQTAADFLGKIPEQYKKQDTLILVENYQKPTARYFIFGKAALRIAWLLGGPWSLVGCLFFFPGFLYNWLYRLVAKNRKKLFSKNSCSVFEKQYSDRFLP